MAVKTKRQKERKALQYADARKRAEEHGSGNRTTLKLPEGVKQFKITKPGTYRLDIAPYRVGEGNPNADEGKIHYERTYWVHRNVGANEDMQVCLRKTFGEDCPICESRAKLAAKAPKKGCEKEQEDELAALAPKERQLFWVFDHDNPDAGWQIWELSYHLFGKHLDNKIKNSDPDEDGYDNFFHLDGQTLRIGAVEKSFGGRDFCEMTDIEFRPRKKPLDADVIDELTPLDDCIQHPEYKDLRKLFLQVGDTKADDSDDDEDEDEDEDDEPAPKKGKKSSTKKKPVDDDEDDEWEDDEDSDDEEDEDEESDDDEDDEPAPKKGKGKKKPADDEDEEDDDEDDEKDSDPDEEWDDESDDEDEDEDEPAPKKGKAKKGKSKPADDDDEDEDDADEDDDEWEDDEDEDDDEPAPKKKLAKGKGKSKKTATAKSKGIKVGSRVEHDEHGECKVVHVSPDGTSLTLKTADGEVEKAIAVDEVERV